MMTNVSTDNATMANDTSGIEEDYYAYDYFAQFKYIDEADFKVTLCQSNLVL